MDNVTHVFLSPRSKFLHFLVFWSSFWIFGFLPEGRAPGRGRGGTICCRSGNIWKDIGLGVGGSAERELRTSSTWSQYCGAVRKSLIKQKHLKCIKDLLHNFLRGALTDFRDSVFLLYCKIFWDWRPTPSSPFFV